jgi:lipoprotein-releasing system permease protein
MIKKWVVFVSSRYTSSSKRGRKLSPGLLSAGGIAVGVMALIIIISVMNGFQMGFIEDIVEISSFHLRVKNIDQEDAAALRDIKGIRSVMPFRESQSLIKTGYSMEPCIIKAVPPNAGLLDPAFFKQLNIVRGGYSPDAEAGIVIGRIMAYRMGVNIGDTVSVIAMNGSDFISLDPAAEGFTVTGIFQSGYNEFDASLVIMDFDDLELIDINSTELYGVKLNNRFADQAAAARIIRAIDLNEKDVISWRTYNKAFFSALKLEKSVMFILLGLIFLVVSFGIFNSTRRTVAEKQEEIGILRALGAVPLQIRQIFIMDGLLIGLAGGLTGTLAGVIITLNINSILSALPLAPGSFLINVPYRIVASEVVLILCFAIAFCVISAYAASKKVSSIMPQDVLRYE